jgi:hypothetical protein
MATITDRYVVVGSVGGDGTTTATSGANAAYASYSAAITGIVAAFPSFVTSDVQVKLHLVSGTDTMSANPTDFTSTTDATRYLDIYFEGAFLLRQTNSFRRLMGWNSFKVVAHDLSMEHSGDRTNGAVAFLLTGVSGGRYELDGGQVLCTGTGTPTAAHQLIDMVGTVPYTIIRRNLLVSGWGTGAGELVMSSGQTLAVDNCTFVNCTTGVPAAATTGGTLLLRNNICQANTTDYGSITGTGTFTHSGNVSADTTSPDTAGRSKTVVFTNAGAGDYSLAGSETYANTSGADLSADATDPFSVDLDGTTRTAPWSSGAYEATAVTNNSPVTTTATVPNPQTVSTLRTITVQAKKSDGSNMTVGGATVVVTITGTNASTPTVTDNSNGTYTCSDTPGTAGTDSVAITIGGTALTASPYASVVQAAATFHAYYYRRRRR